MRYHRISALIQKCPTDMQLSSSLLLPICRNTLSERHVVLATRCSKYMYESKCSCMSRADLRDRALRNTLSSPRACRLLSLFSHAFSNPKAAQNVSIVSFVAHLPPPCVSSAGGRHGAALQEAKYSIVAFRIRR